jgi:transglutaminase-like putative cysteine protease
MKTRAFLAFLRRFSLVVPIAAGCFSGLSPAAAQSKPAPGQTASDQGASATAAPATPTPAPKPPELSKEALVFDKHYTHIREEADGTGTRETTARVRILADAGVKQMAVLNFTYTASNQQVDIAYVRVVKPDGTIVVTPAYNVQDMPADVTREAPMYSDIHQKHVAVKGLGVGDTLEYDLTLSTFKPEVPGQFWLEYSFQKNLIVLDEQLDLDVPNNQSVTVASDDVQPGVTASAGRKLYHWSSSNLARPDPDAPPKSTKHWKPSVQVTTFTSWQQVGDWYASLQKEPLAVTPAIQARAAALTKGLTSDEDKVRALFNDVALHIHYVGLSFGIGRYQPHSADDVLSNEYGDCKDKHTLLAALLKAAGYEAWPVLISSTRELDEQTPSPAQFNHVITAVPLAGKLLWMDSTAETAPMGLLLSPVRDKQGLAVPPVDPAHIERTPANPPVPGLFKFLCSGQLDEHGHFTGHIEETMQGDFSVAARNAFRNTSEAQWKELLERILRSQGFGGEISNPKIAGVLEPDKPFHADTDYSREKYYQWNEDASAHWIGAPTPQMGGELAPGIKQIKPADDPPLSALGSNFYDSTITLPKDWTATLPPRVDLVEDWAEYHAQYSVNDGALPVLRTMLIKKDHVPLEDWDRFLAFRRAMFVDENHQSLIAPPDQDKRKRH